MRIGIIGAGNIGGSLGAGWAKGGHEVMFGARDPNSDKTRKALEAAGTDVKVGTPAEAAAFGEVVVLAVPWPNVREVIPAMGDLSGKILVDTTNRFTPPSPDDGPFAAADVAKLAGGAKVVKAFNTLGWEGLVDPTFSGHRVATFVCADDADARQTVMDLATELGLDAKDCGALANAQHVEGMGKVWVYLMRNGAGRDMAFTVLER